MRLRWVIPAKSVELDSDGFATITKAGVDGIYVWEFPAPARVVLGVNVYGSAMEFAEFSVWVTVDGPNFERVEERQFPFPDLRAAASGEAFVEPTLTLPITFEFQADGPGLHIVNVRTDQGDPWSIPFEVRSVSTES